MQHVVGQPGNSVTIHAPAKLNLCLAVIARRPDGFHEIESLMVPVTLHDTLHVTAEESPGIRLTVRHGGRLARLGPRFAGEVPTDATNLVVRAAERLASEAGVEGGLSIELVKQIPSGAGMGGGSSDAAAVLLAAADVWGIDWPQERLAELGAEIGSDVPWFFAAGPAIVTGRGEMVHPVAGIPSLPAVVVKPPVGLSTAAVYGRCVPDPARRGEAARLATALGEGLRNAIPFMHNALEPPARELCADVEQLLGDFRRAGGLHPLLTGSGSACFAITRTAAESRHVAARMEAMGWEGVFPVRLCA
jgi:4-diphosphocytidyl-2-C-methyl-D-erythritol kinase